MNERNRDIVDEMTSQLRGLIAVFDLAEASTGDGLRKDTFSDFSFFIIEQLEDLYKKAEQIQTR
jgi:hypothetical protein